MKTILITGGSGKIGKVLVTHFVSKGWRVAFTCRSMESKLATIRSVETDSKNILGIVADFENETATSEILLALNEKNWRVNALVNNARSLSYLATQENGIVSRTNFCNEYLVDVVAVYELCMALASLDNSALENIINISSQYGVVAANPSLYANPTIESPIHYGVAKAALNHLTRELAIRLAEKKIRVNCVAYGGVEGRVDQTFKDNYSALCPSGRMLVDSDLPGPVEFLASQSSSGMTGEIISVDGGWTLW